MTSRAERRFRPTLRATVLLLPALALLVGLGVWQLERLDWKRELIAELRAREQAPAIALPEPIGDPRAIEYRRVRLDGRFLHGRELYLGARPYGGRPGYHVLTPFRLVDGRTVLVERGWVPKAARDPSTRRAGQVESTIAVEGVLRTGGWKGSGLFRPANQPEDNVWLWKDLPAMAKAAGLEDAVTAVYVRLAADQTPGELPIARPSPVDRRNQHLQYALTWFALAAALLAVYVVYHWRHGMPEREGE